MGTGKTAVGRALAARLGARFVDTDVLVEEAAGRPIARIFAEDGEAAFRRLEARAVAEAAAPGGAVIATGGGVVLSAENMARLRRGGVVVALEAAPEAILARVGPGADRPLLGTDPAASVRRLLAERAPLYAAADLVVETSHLPVDAVVERVLAFLRQREGGSGPARPAARVAVALGPRGYDIWVGAGVLEDAAAYLRGVGIRGRVMLVTHPRLETLYGRALAERLQAAGLDAAVCTVPASESSKSLRMAERLYRVLAGAGADRETAVLALGGGVVGDLAGFVAATFMRGIRWATLPTTLLAQVDAGIGGKTGINLVAKNLVGAVHQPAVVLADTAALRSLPVRDLRSGMAEVVKTGVIGDPALFEYAEREAPRCLGREPEALGWVVTRCAAYKARVVAADEREAGERMLLNYGHTIGHGIEAAAGYRRVTHGEAVAVGMMLEGRVAARMGVCDAGLVARQEAVLVSLGLPAALRALAAPGLTPDRIAAAMAHDKKAVGGRLRFVLPQALGRPVIRDDVPAALVEEVLAAG
jgi:shikimate kinase/3-dehydroquinate synthase